MEMKASVAASRMARVLASRSVRVRSASRRCRSARASRTTPIIMTRPRMAATASTVARSSRTLASASWALTSAVTVHPIPGTGAYPDRASPSTSIERVTPDRPASASRTRGSDAAETRPSTAGAWMPVPAISVPRWSVTIRCRPWAWASPSAKSAMVSSGYTTPRMATTGLVRSAPMARTGTAMATASGCPAMADAEGLGHVGRTGGCHAPAPIPRREVPADDLRGERPDIGHLARGGGEEGPSVAGRCQLGELSFDHRFVEVGRVAVGQSGDETAGGWRRSW